MRTANFMFYGEDSRRLRAAFNSQKSVRIMIGGVGYMMQVVSRRETYDTRPKDTEKVFVYDLMETV